MRAPTWRRRPRAPSGSPAGAAPGLRRASTARACPSSHERRDLEPGVITKQSSAAFCMYASAGGGARGTAPSSDRPPPTSCRSRHRGKAPSIKRVGEGVLGGAVADRAQRAAAAMSGPAPARFAPAILRSSVSDQSTSNRSRIDAVAVKSAACAPSPMGVWEPSSKDSWLDRRIWLPRGNDSNQPPIELCSVPHGGG